MATVRLEKTCDECGVISVLNIIEDGDQLRLTGTVCVHMRDSVQERVDEVTKADGGSGLVNGFVIKRPSNPELN